MQQGRRSAIGHPSNTVMRAGSISRGDSATLPLAGKARGTSRCASHLPRQRPILAERHGLQVGWMRQQLRRGATPLELANRQIPVNRKGILAPAAAAFIGSAFTSPVCPSG